MRGDPKASTQCVSEYRRPQTSDVVSLAALCPLGHVLAREHTRPTAVVHTTHMWRDPVIEVYKQHVDRTLLRENLRLTVEERFRKLMDLQSFAEELQRAGREARRRDRTK